MSMKIKDMIDWVLLPRRRSLQVCSECDKFRWRVALCFGPDSPNKLDKMCRCRAAKNSKLTQSAQYFRKEPSEKCPMHLEHLACLEKEDLSSDMMDLADNLKYEEMAFDELAQIIAKNKEAVEGWRRRHEQMS